MADEFGVRRTSNFTTNPEEEEYAALAVSGGPVHPAEPRLQIPDPSNGLEGSATPSQPPTTFNHFQDLHYGSPPPSPTSAGGDTTAQGRGFLAPHLGGGEDRCVPTEATTPQLPSSAADPGEGDFLSVHDKVLEENRKLRDGLLCLICNDADRNVVLLPCGHVAACTGCADKCARPPDGRCPVCRDPVEEIYPILLSPFVDLGGKVIN